MADEPNPEGTKTDPFSVTTVQWEEDGGSIKNFRWFPEIEKAIFNLPDHVVEAEKGKNGQEGG